MNPRFVTATVSLAALAVLATSCSSSTKTAGSAPAPASSGHSMPMTPSGSTAQGAPATAPDASQAATLRSTLTSQLSDHVWLAGNALDSAVHKGGNLKDPAVVGAVKALDDNSVALSKTLGSVYPAAAAPFLASWRQHIGFFVNYTLGKATKNQAMAAKAKSDLDSYRTSFGQLIHSVVPQLPADAVAQELIPHVQTLLDAIDADITASPDYQTKLTMAADHMPMTAAILAGGIVADKHITT